MVCPRCGQEPISRGEFISRSDWHQLDCRNCGTHLIVSSRSKFQAVTLIVLVLIPLIAGGHWAVQHQYASALLVTVIQIFVCIALAIFSDAYKWRFFEYRYTPQSPQSHFTART